MPRLMKGMFKRGRVYYARFYRGGREQWISLAPDYETACRKLRHIRDEGAPPTAGRITVRQAAEQWMESYIKTRRVESDHGMVRQRLRDYLLEFMGHMQANKVTKEDVRAYRLWMERDGKIKPATVKHILSDLRCLMNWAVDADLIDKSPVPKRIMPKIQERPPDRLTDEELDAVLGVPEPYAFVIRVLAGTGLRSCFELAARILRWSAPTRERNRACCWCIRRSRGRCGVFRSRGPCSRNSGGVSASFFG
jgi:integrase